MHVRVSLDELPIANFTRLRRHTKLFLFETSDFCGLRDFLLPALLRFNLCFLEGFTDDFDQGLNVGSETIVSKPEGLTTREWFQNLGQVCSGWHLGIIDEYGENPLVQFEG